MTISRKGFLTGMGWMTAGAALGVAGRSGYFRAAAAARGSAPAPPPKDPDVTPGVESYSQCGEDLVVDFACRYLSIKDITYLDVGAYHPTKINNTYYFYLRGHRGVLVEPNVAMCEVLRRVRPGDTTLEAGIGVAAAREADYYVMTDPSWNTFSKEEAEHQEKVTKGGIRIKEVRKMPLLDINDVMAKHFKGAPTYLSVDAEGLHLAILKTIDFGRFRPRFVCAETLVSGTKRTIPEIPSFMESQGYVARGGSFVNTIFVDGKVL
jgi:hypothetical protein